MRSEFIVIDKGENDNVLNGDKFKVFKGSKFLGIGQVIETRKDVLAFDTSYLDKSIPLSSKDVLVLRNIKDDERYSQKDPYATRQDYADIRIYKGPGTDTVSEKSSVIAKPFKKVKEWTVGAGRGVKRWFEAEKEEEKHSLYETEGAISSVSGVDSLSIKLEMNVNTSRRKTLFAINEELKNRGFIVTNYSLIEGVIDAQKPLQLSTFSEIFANMRSAIDYRIIYTVSVRNVGDNFTNVKLDVSTSYKKSKKYIKMNVSSNGKVAQEAQDILVTVKRKLR